MKRVIPLALLCLLVVLSTPLEAASKKGEIFIFNNRNLPQSFDPALSSDIYARNILNQLFEGLTASHPRDLSVLPGVAKYWKAAKDGTVYTFYLDSKAVWSDGSRVHADDFRFAWLRLLDPQRNAPYASLLYVIKNGRAYHKGEIQDAAKVGIRTVASDVLEVTLENPLPYFLQLTAFYPLFPLPRRVVEKYGNAWEQPSRFVGNGPFSLHRRKGSALIVLRKNPKYRQAETIHFDEVRAYGIQEPSKALAMYQRGQMDYTGETPIPFKDLTKWRYTTDFHAVPWFAVNFLRFNTKRAPLDDPQVREALSLVIDRAKITNYIVAGGNQPTYSIVPMGIKGYEPPQVSAVNVKRARKLLQQAGYCTPDEKFSGCKEFPQITFLLDNNVSYRKLALGIQQMFKNELGLQRVELKILDFQSYLKARRSMDFHIARSGWSGDYFDPNTFLELWTGDHPNNNTGWANPQYDKWIRLASIEQNPKKRMTYFSKAERILLNDYPVVPIFTFTKTYLLKPYVQGFVDNLQRVLCLQNVFIDRDQLAP